MTMTEAPETQTFCLPDLGEGLTSAEVIQWKVAVGDTVALDQSVVEVETVKAVVDIPIPFAGVVRELHGPPGASVTVGAPLISVGPAPSGSPAQQPTATGSGSVLVGYGTGGSPRPERSVSEVRPRDEAPVRQPLVISPVVRQLATSHGIDIASLAPSGAGGVVLRRDVEAAIAEGDTLRPVRTPLHGAHRAMAEAVTRSRREIPDVTVWVEADATSLFRARDTLRAAGNAGLTVLALFARICLAGLQRYPVLNSQFNAGTGEIVRLPRVHLGFAAQTDGGLLVPVMHDADGLTTRQLNDGIRQLTEAARAGNLTPKDSRGGTFTLNNYGVFGVDGATPIIRHPEAAMLSIGRCADRPWVVDGRLTVRRTTQLSLTFDHRVCDGETAAGFLRFVADLTENPVLLLDAP